VRSHPSGAKWHRVSSVLIAVALLTSACAKPTPVRTATTVPSPEDAKARYLQQVRTWFTYINEGGKFGKIE
jgi:hypothetical protein